MTEAFGVGLLAWYISFVLLMMGERPQGMSAEMEVKLAMFFSLIPALGLFLITL
jgi:hypothetical protein